MAKLKKTGYLVNAKLPARLKNLKIGGVPMNERCPCCLRIVCDNKEHK